jgi:predicted RNA-binding protein associated with RNAse of E/G family
MERKFANYPGWKRILKSHFTTAYLDTPEYKGYITLYCMDAVTSPLVVEYFQRKIRIADAGYAWLKQFPDGEHFTVTTHYDAGARIVLWYIDICLRTGAGQDGIPWMDDLYLDLVVSPAMKVKVKDAHELLDARESGDISAAEFELAWRVADRLTERIERRQLDLLALSDVHRRMLLK